MLNALLVDNNQEAISSLEALLDENCPQIRVCGQVNTVEDAFCCINKEIHPDLVFSEVDLPDDNGFRLTEANELANFEIIYVTKNPAYALKAIKRQVVGFLIKPVKRRELIHVVHIAEDRIYHRKLTERNSLLLKQYEKDKAQKDTIGIPTIEGFEIIHPEDIIRCEGMQNCTRIITKDRSDIISSYNLGKFIKLFGNEIFFSPHKSHLVNFQHVKKFLREGTIIMIDGSHVPVSKRRKGLLLEYFKHF